MKQPYSINQLMRVGFHVILCICGLLGVCTSCSKDEQELADAVPLRFSWDAVDEARASSRAEAYSGKFGVYAKIYAPENATGKPYMTNVEVTANSEGVCGTEKDYYWAVGDTHFAAYSPYTSTPESEAVKVTLPDTPYAGYRYEGTVDGYTDYMFSDERMGGYEDFPPNGTVPILFHHALTKVEFFVKLSKVQEGTTSWSFDVESLELVNLHNKGNISFTHKDGIAYNTWVSNNSNDVWNFNENSNDRKDMTIADEIMNITDTHEHQIGEALYLMPQLLENANESGCQSLIVQYKQHTTRGGTTKTVTNIATVPLRTSNIAKWGINNYMKYVLLLEPNGSMELVAEVQPWEYVETVNEFSDTVGMDSDEDLLKWDETTCLNDDKTQNILTVNPDINQHARFSFRIGSPLGSTWYAMLRPKKGNPSAFRLAAVENANITDGVALGAVGDRVTLEVVATDANPTETNEAELIFIVICNGEILSAEVVVGTDESNYVIKQNINI